MLVTIANDAFADPFLVVAGMNSRWLTRRHRLAARLLTLERTHFTSCVPEQRPHSLGPWGLAGAESFGTFEGILDRKIISRQVARALLAVGYETPRPLDAGDAD